MNNTNLTELFSPLLKLFFYHSFARKPFPCSNLTKVCSGKVCDEYGNGLNGGVDVFNITTNKPWLFNIEECDVCGTFTVENQTMTHDHVYWFCKNGCNWKPCKQKVEQWQY